MRNALWSQLGWFFIGCAVVLALCGAQGGWSALLVWPWILMIWVANLFTVTTWRFARTALDTARTAPRRSGAPAGGAPIAENLLALVQPVLSLWFWGVDGVWLLGSPTTWLGFHPGPWQWPHGHTTMAWVQHDLGILLHAAVVTPLSLIGDRAAYPVTLAAGAVAIDRSGSLWLHYDAAGLGLGVLWVTVWLAIAQGERWGWYVLHALWHRIRRPVISASAPDPQAPRAPLDLHTYRQRSTAASRKGVSP